MLKVMWFGYGGSAYLAEDLRSTIEGLGMSLTTIHEWDNADIKWELGTWLDNLKQADIIIIPTNYEKQPAKSNTRLTQALSIGKPVICGPLDAYFQVYKKFPGSFLIAYTKEDWEKYLRDLKDNQDLRNSLRDKALRAAQDYSIDTLGKKWAEILYDIKLPCISDGPVDLIIVNYNNARYLKLCVESIQKNTTYPYQLIISDAGSNEETWEYLESLKGVKIVGDRMTRKNYSEASNDGIKASESDFFAILNSDLIVSEHWLENIMDKIKNIPGLAACGVLSNCDKGWLHDLPLKLEKSGIDLYPGMLYETIEPHIGELYDYMAELNVQNRGSYKEQEWVAGYATVFLRRAVDEIGFFDPKFRNGCEDLDFCKRLKNKNYKMGQALDSFVFHFGGVSRGAYQQEDREEYNKEDQANHIYLHQKWDKKSVVIYTGPMWYKWDFRNVNEGGVGGSETWAVMLARELNALGYQVKVFADCPEPGLKDGDIEYLHFTQYNEYIDYHWVDYFISSRTTDPFGLPLRAGKKFVQIHDIFLLSPKDQLFLDKIDKFSVLSQWHWDFVKGYHGLTDDKLVMSFNGLDFNRYNVSGIERHPHRMFWSSSLDRGLDTLLYLFPFIKAQIPDLELHVFYGTEIWEAAIKQRNNPDELKKLEEIKAGLKQPGVFYHGKVGQKELAVEQLKSSLWAYPTDFEETFCITAIEAQRAGCPVLASNYAGLQTTVGDSGILVGNGTKSQALTKEFREEFVSKCVQIFKDKELWQEFSDRGRKNTEKYSWQKVALRWQEIFNQ